MSSEKTNTKIQILFATWKLMEQQAGKGVKMRDIAKETGISRQAIYLHFKTRSELMIATVQYVDEIKGLNTRLEQLKKAPNGKKLLDAFIEVWGNYIPEIYGIAKSLLLTKDTDEATAVAWDGCMSGLRKVCDATIEQLNRERNLSTEWTTENASEMLWSIVSIHQWEQLTIECGWSTESYIKHMQNLVQKVFIQKL